MPGSASGILGRTQNNVSYIIRQRCFLIAQSTEVILEEALIGHRGPSHPDVQALFGRIDKYPPEQYSMVTRC
jgi:hypothetical protein